VGATEDALFTPAMAAAAAAGWGTTPVMLDGIGHDVMLDAGWERAADTLADWVRPTPADACRLLHSRDGRA